MRQEVSRGIRRREAHVGIVPRRVLGLHVLQGGGVGSGVWELRRDQNTLLGIENKVHERHGRIGMRCALGNSQVVKPDAAAFCRTDVDDVLILIVSQGRITVVHQTRPGLAGDQRGFGIVAVEEQDIRLELDELLFGGIKLLWIRRVLVVAEDLQRHARHFTAVIQHYQVVCELRIPQICPALGLKGHAALVVGEGRGAPLVWHRVLVAWIVVLVGETRVDILEVRDLGKIDGLQHVLTHHDSHGVVAGNHDIVA